MKAQKALNQAVDSIVVPAEWAPQKAIWTAWPSHGNLWLENLEPARKEVAAMILALATQGPVNVLAMGKEAEASAKKALASPKVKIIPAKFGDIWLRDTGPIFVRDKDGKKAAATFGFNGWGGKYKLPHDAKVSAFVAKKSGVRVIKNDFILEGGSLEHDGEGAILTTRECLLNKNRKPGGGKTVVEKKLKNAFGAKHIYWLNKGLKNDHTDGHVDNLARFVAPRHALCQSASGRNDPNAKLFKTVAADLKKMGLKVTQIPSPGLVTNEDGEAVAASHMNYIIYNKVIVLPTYEDVCSKKAAAALKKLFPKHRIVPLPARHVLTGGGSFHCITQQEF